MAMVYYQISCGCFKGEICIKLSSDELVVFPRADSDYFKYHIKFGERIS